jgi:dihydropteroate synthase
MKRHWRRTLVQYHIIGLLSVTFELVYLNNSKISEARMYTLNCKGKILTIETAIVMGIINITPDSFYAGSRQQALQDIVQQAKKMLDEGAAILDIGGQSTRPGSEQVGAEEEIKRVVPAIAAIQEQFPEAIISIDTYHASVAKAAIEAGAAIVNDVSGGMLDAYMLDTVAALKVPYVCMHMQGTPATMQHSPAYNDVTKEVLDFFIERTDACRRAGIHDVIIDPGFGFGKTIEHNFTLLKNLSVFKILEKPILLGISRKSSIYKTLGSTANEALNGTTVLNTVGLINGAAILRVHDVKEAVEAVKLLAHL